VPVTGLVGLLVPVTGLVALLVLAAS
jgi:hypothetical protein